MYRCFIKEGVYWCVCVYAFGYRFEIVQDRYIRLVIRVREEGKRGGWRKFEGYRFCNILGNGFFFILMVGCEIF